MFSRELQQEWIGAAVWRCCVRRGCIPRVWVAPRHGMDLTTLDVLREEGIAVVSDGFAKGPYREHGLTWIPQQLWAPVGGLVFSTTPAFELCQEGLERAGSVSSQAKSRRSLRLWIELLAEWPAGQGIQGKILQRSGIAPLADDFSYAAFPAQAMVERLNVKSFLPKREPRERTANI